MSDNNCLPVIIGRSICSSTTLVVSHIDEEEASWLQTSSKLAFSSAKAFTVRADTVDSSKVMEHKLHAEVDVH